MKIARVFPRRTRAAPIDDLAFVGEPPLFPVDCDQVHISVTFTWDLPEAQRLALAWQRIAPVQIGGPATGQRGEDFTPGMYLRPGYVITSRGCPNNCWFCCVPKREGALRELPITEGWNVLDDNLLACSERHVIAVLDMLCRQVRPAEFTGGLEAARLTPALAEGLRRIRPKQVFFAYDEPSDLEPLRRAADLCWRTGFTPASHVLRAFVLCGYPGDTMAAASERMEAVVKLGLLPMAMVWRSNELKPTRDWRQFQRTWARPAIIACSRRG